VPFVSHPPRSAAARALREAGNQPVFETRDLAYFAVAVRPASSGATNAPPQGARDAPPDIADIAADPRIIEHIRHLDARRRAARRITVGIYWTVLALFAITFVLFFFDSTPACVEPIACARPPWELRHTMMAVTMVLVAIGAAATLWEAKHTRRAVDAMERLNADLAHLDHIPGAKARRDWVDRKLRELDI
jgi:hypothetical protein